MEILNPPLIAVGSGMYRLNPGDVTEEEPLQVTTAMDALEDSIEEPAHGAIDDYRITETERGYEAKINIPSALIKFVLGQKGATKKKIEYETKSQITVPGHGKTGPVVVRSADKSYLSSALTRIEVVAESGRAKTQFTHFISIPLNHKSIQDGFTEFKNVVLDKYKGERGVEEGVFQISEKLHLTLGTLTLLDDLEIEQASGIFHDLKDEILSDLSDGLRIEVRGLDYMNDDTTSVDVLYARVVDIDNRLQNICDKIIQHVNDSGILNNDFHRNQVKLHMTVMNSKFRQKPVQTKPGGDNRRNQRHQTRESFNAQSIINDLKDFKFGDCTLSEIHLSKRHALACDGYYEPLTVITVNNSLDRPIGCS